MDTVAYRPLRLDLNAKENGNRLSLGPANKSLLSKCSVHRTMVPLFPTSLLVASRDAARALRDRAENMQYFDNGSLCQYLNQSNKHADHDSSKHNPRFEV